VVCDEGGRIPFPIDDRSCDFVPEHEWPEYTCISRNMGLFPPAAILNATGVFVRTHLFQTSDSDRGNNLVQQMFLGPGWPAVFVSRLALGSPEPTTLLNDGGSTITCLSGPKSPALVRVEHHSHHAKAHIEFELRCHHAMRFPRPTYDTVFALFALPG
jgi:hypothetical protein